MTTVLPLRGLKLGVRVVLFVSALGILLGSALAQQIPLFGPPKKQQKRAAELIRRQEPPMVIPRVLERATPDNVSIYISLGKQRAYFRVYEEIAVDSPISSGKRAGMTPAWQLQDPGKGCRSSVQHLRRLCQSAHRQGGARRH